MLGRGKTRHPSPALPVEIMSAERATGNQPAVTSVTGGIGTAGEAGCLFTGWSIVAAESVEAEPQSVIRIFPITMAAAVAHDDADRHPGTYSVRETAVAQYWRPLLLQTTAGWRAFEDPGTSIFRRASPESVQIQESGDCSGRIPGLNFHYESAFSSLLTGLNSPALE